MAIVNHAKKEINAKVVYYGPASSGKTTNIKFIYEKMKPEYRGPLKFLNTQSGKIYFFDFMRPDQIGIKGYNIRFHIYTVPGDIVDYSIWKTVLKGMDGLVFVADSNAGELPSNQDALLNLTDYLGTLDTDLHEIPCIFQCNKQEISGSLTPEEMKMNLAVENLPMIPAVAQKGEGVLNTLSNIVKMVMLKLRDAPLGIEEEELSITPEPELAVAKPELAVAEPEPAVAEPEPAVAEPEFAALSSIETSSEIQSQPTFVNHCEEVSSVVQDQFASTSIDEDLSSVATLDASAFNKFTYSTSAQLTVEEIEPSPQDTESAEIHAGIDFSGEVEQIAPGCFRLPITITCGDIQKSVALTVSLTLGNPDRS